MLCLLIFCSSYYRATHLEEKPIISTVPLFTDDNLRIVPLILAGVPGPIFTCPCFSQACSSTVPAPKGAARSIHRCWPPLNPHTLFASMVPPGPDRFPNDRPERPLTDHIILANPEALSLRHQLPEHRTLRPCLVNWVPHREPDEPWCQEEAKDTLIILPIDQLPLFEGLLKVKSELEQQLSQQEQPISRRPLRDTSKIVIGRAFEGATQVTLAPN